MCGVLILEKAPNQTGELFSSAGGREAQAASPCLRDEQKGETTNVCTRKGSLSLFPTSARGKRVALLPGVVGVQNDLSSHTPSYGRGAYHMPFAPQ